jgi:aminoglycoside phosphotransferase (APT) family kinase protein
MMVFQHIKQSAGGVNVRIGDSTRPKPYIPETKEDVSKDLVENLLRTRFPGINVRAIELLEEIHGTAAKLYIRVEHEGADGLPDRMWLKAGFPASHLERMLSMSIYATEAKYYSELQPLVNVRVPECYAAAYDNANGRGVVLIENLDKPGIVFPKCTQPLSVGQVASGLDLFADLHGRSWEREWLYKHGLSKFLSPGSTMEKSFRTFSVEYIDSFIKGPVGEVVPAEVRDAQRVYDSIWRLQPFYQQGPFCLLHGDAHPGNSFVVTASDDVGMLDWQVPVIGPWAHDVTYWLVGCLSVDDRRRFERELLTNYLSRLAQNGGAEIDPGDAWDSYRRFIAYGYWIWLRCPPTQQPIENNIALSERFGAAMADHHVFRLLGL